MIESQGAVPPLSEVDESDLPTNCHNRFSLRSCPGKPVGSQARKTSSDWSLQYRLSHESQGGSFGTKTRSVVATKRCQSGQDPSVSWSGTSIASENVRCMNRMLLLPPEIHLQRVSTGTWFCLTSDELVLSRPKLPCDASRRLRLR